MKELPTQFDELIKVARKQARKAKLKKVDVKQAITLVKNNQKTKNKKFQCRNVKIS